eukprot:748457-Hanusia_phi.AAC.4
MRFVRKRGGGEGEVDGEGLFVEDKEGIEQGGPQWFAGIKATGRKRKLWFSGDSARRKLPCTDGKVARSKGKVMSTIQGRGGSRGSKPDYRSRRRSREVP